MLGLNISESPGASGLGLLSGVLISHPEGWLEMAICRGYGKTWTSRLSVHMYAQEFFVVQKRAKGRKSELCP